MPQTICSRPAAACLPACPPTRPPAHPPARLPLWPASRHAALLHLLPLRQGLTQAICANPDTAGEAIAIAIAAGNTAVATATAKAVVAAWPKCCDAAARASELVLGAAREHGLKSQTYG